MTRHDADRKLKILHHIAATLRARGYPPSVREIAGAVGLSSTSAVHHHLQMLEREGYLERGAAQSRAIRLTQTGAALATLLTLSEIDVIFGEGGVDVVLDTVGGVRFSEALKAVGHGGRVVALANVALEPSAVDTRDFYPKNVTIHGFQLHNLVERLGYDARGDLEDLARLAARGELKVHVDATFPLAEAAEAHRHMEGRRNRGKVMLKTRE